MNKRLREIADEFENKTSGKQPKKQVDSDEMLLIKMQSLLTTEQNDDEVVPKDAILMQNALENMRAFLLSRARIEEKEQGKEEEKKGEEKKEEKSVADYLLSKNSSTFICDMIDLLNNQAQDTDFEVWVRNQWLPFADDNWGDSDSELFPDLTNWFQRSEVALQLVLTRFVATADLKVLIDNYFEEDEKEREEGRLQWLEKEAKEKEVKEEKGEGGQEVDDKEADNDDDDATEEEKKDEKKHPLSDVLVALSLQTSVWKNKE